MIMNQEQFPTYKSLFPVQTNPTTSQGAQSDKNGEKG